MRKGSILGFVAAWGAFASGCASDDPSGPPSCEAVGVPSGGDETSGKAWDTTLASTLGRKTAGAAAMDPIYLDIDWDGKLNVQGGQRIAFDINGDGIVDVVHEWNTRDGQLVYDANGNGIVDDGREIMNETGIDGEQNKYGFGWQKARDLFDVDADGVIDGDELEGVSIWIDSNGDGVTDACELRSAIELNIVAIDTVNGAFTVDPRAR